MNLAALAQGIGSTGLFASRVFLPALLTALMLRFGPDFPVLHHLGLLHHLQHGKPIWFTSAPSIIVLAILSAVEIVAQKNAEARQVLHEIDVWGKTIVATLTSFGVITSTDSKFVHDTLQHAGYLDALIPLIVAIGTFRISRTRNAVARAYFDHIDGTHLASMTSWLEELWVIFGAFLLVLFPVLMLLLIAVATGVLFLLRKRMAVEEEHRKTACVSCGMMIYPCAMACPSCRTAVAEPAAVGFLGQSKPWPTEDRDNQPYRLAEKRRCPVCASRLVLRKPFEACSVCGQAALAEPDFADAYIACVARRLPIVLMICFLMSLVPVFGLIVGAIYYRMELVLPFSQYLPMGRRFLLRWMIRVLFLVMILLQVVPLLGGLVVPLMALINFSAYRKSFRDFMLEPRASAHAAAGPPPLPAM